MDEDKRIDNEVYSDDNTVFNKKTKTRPKKEINIGIDTTNKLLKNIVAEGEKGSLDISVFNRFTEISQRRDELYNLLDMMAQDSIIAAILETYTEDATEYDDNNRIVSAIGDDAKAIKMVNYLLESLQVDKHIYQWVNSLCKYGDLYLQLFKSSEYSKDEIFDNLNKNNKNQLLNEELDKDLKEAFKIAAYKKDDHFIDYIEAVSNPAEMFELTRFGKTQGYLKAPSRAPLSTFGQNDILNKSTQFLYSFKQKDVVCYPANKFVHAALEDNKTRGGEEVILFRDNENEEDSIRYNVRRGQSLLYNTFKIWRELSLLENSILLNRITKSSIIRMINVEVGDMPKEDVGPHLQRIKSLIEQKAAIDTGNSINEYTNPGPIENNIYVPTHGGVGAISTEQIGGDVNVHQLPDIEYFQNRFFGSLRIPKHFFGLTDDGAGFNGGESLAIISSRYAKMVKRIQSVMVQVITDAINLLLLDKGLNSYIGKFTIQMTAPVTKDEISRRENEVNKIGMVGDIMNQLSDIKNTSTRLRILKILLSTSIKDPDILSILEQEIEEIESEENKGDQIQKDSEEFDSDEPLDLESDYPISVADEIDYTESEKEIEPEIELETSEEERLPTPSELDLGDLSDNRTEI